MTITPLIGNSVDYKASDLPCNQFSSIRMSSKLKLLSQSFKLFNRTMCYEVTCSTCKKTTWGGCGRHVPSVYNRIAEGQHCGCRDWPGVKKKSGDGSSAAVSSSVDGGVAADGGSTCSIL